jgi:hypothetical protein cdiviTM7_03019
MNKDVIYIDTEDDITTIISKIKASKERIIALVPPRRIGVLQSAVNIRLLARAANSVDKRIVLITNDTVLAGLAATAKIPVAKTLQSKPEIAEIPALKIDDENDVIDGGKLAVGDMADAAKKPAPKGDAAIDSVIAAADKKEPKAINTLKSMVKKPKVPDFNMFRKKFLLIGGGALLLVVFLVWAIWFAPHATVVISAKTTSTTVSEAVSLSEGASTDAKAKVIKSIKKELAKEVSVEFAATGKKNVGEKAKGVVNFKNSSPSSITIASGTILKNSGLSYTLNSSVTVPGATLGWSCPGRTCAGSASGTITAAEGGAQYNAATGSMSISVDDISASLRSATSGGTDKTATVVTAGDIEAAKSKLGEQKVDGLKEKLASSFGSSAKVIVESYAESRSNPSPSVAVDGEATGAVTLKTTITASMSAIDKSELKNFVEAKLKDEISGKKSQRIYDDGVDKVTFSQFAVTRNGQTVRLTVNGKVGPEIKESNVKDQAKGRSYGEVQSAIEAIDGVEDVDVKFSPFWVKSVPNDINKINVEFKLKDVK